MVPEMNVLSPDRDDGSNQYSTQGDFENALVYHIKCSIAKGFALVKDKHIPDASWIYGDKWGTSATLTLQVDELSGASPSLSTTNQYGNLVRTLPNKLSATYPQEVLFGFGASGTAHSTRAEMIQFTFANSDLLQDEERARTYQISHGRPATGMDCNTNLTNGLQIQSDLKIENFIWDKATIVQSAVTGSRRYPFDAIQETLTFVASFGGSVTPTWHIEQVILNPTSPLLSATRTETNTLLITLGPLQPKSEPLALQSAASNQHQAASIGVDSAGSAKGSQ